MTRIFSVYKFLNYPFFICKIYHLHEHFLPSVLFFKYQICKLLKPNYVYDFYLSVCPSICCVFFMSSVQLSICLKYSFISKFVPYADSSTNYNRMFQCFIFFCSFCFCFYVEFLNYFISASHPPSIHKCGS